MKTILAFLFLALATANAASRLRGPSDPAAKAEGGLKEFEDLMMGRMNVLEVLAPVLGAEDNPQQQLHDRRLHVWARKFTKAQLDGTCNWWISHFAKMGVPKKGACGWLNMKTLSLPGICPEVCPMSESPHLCAYINYDTVRGNFDTTTACGSVRQGGATCMDSCCKRHIDYCDGAAPPSPPPCNDVPFGSWPAAISGFASSVGISDCAGAVAGLASMGVSCDMDLAPLDASLAGANAGQLCAKTCGKCGGDAGANAKCLAERGCTYTEGRNGRVYTNVGSQKSPWEI